MKADRKISLAITHFERFDMLLESFVKVKNDERLDQILIVDDCSQDGSWEKILYQLGAGNIKFRRFRNKKNLDCYRNKKEAVSKATNEWVILLDSDNIIDKPYIDAIYQLDEWNPDCVYTPEFARPHFDFRKFSDKFILSWDLPRLMNDPKFRTMLNAANYFVHRDSYLDVWDGSVNPHTSDSIFQMYNWFKSDRMLAVVPGMQYEHRIHDQSHFKLNHHKTGTFEQEVVEQLKGLKKC